MKGNTVHEIPLIDREVFFGNPEISSGEISPDGKHLAFLKAYNGIMNIWVKSLDEDFEKAIPLTNNERPLGGYFWTYDSKHILYVKDNKGDENFNIYAVNPHSKDINSSDLPTSTNLTPFKEVAATIYEVSKSEPNILWVGINDRDKAWHDLYKLDIQSKKLELVFENRDRIVGWAFDWEENLRLAYRTTEQGISEILKLDENYNFTKIFETNLKEHAFVTGWYKDNSKVYLVTNKGSVNFSSLYLFDLNTLDIEKLEDDPKQKVDFGTLSIHENTREILYTSYTDDKNIKYWKNKYWEGIYNRIQKDFEGKEISIVSADKDYQKLLVGVGGDKYASETYLYDLKSDTLTKQYTSRPKLKEVEYALTPMKAISYKSSDGLNIPGYLTLPLAVKPEQLPLVIFVHGGPKGPRDYWGYNAYVQMLANRGYAVLQPNFRASGGYGKRFLNAGDKEWGKKMQDDITWGVNHLVNLGIADYKKIAIMGGSYGGYATLAGLTFTPDLYVCGVDIVGPSNLFTLLKSIPPYWEAGRKWLYEMVGDPNTEEGKILLKESSPLFQAENINKPLLIIQGANDPRVKQAESDQIVVSLRNKNKDVEYLLANDEGHGFQKPLNNKAMWVAIERFLAKHLGGKFQAEIETKTSERLNALTQDIQKVTS